MSSPTSGIVSSLKSLFERLGSTHSRLIFPAFIETLKNSDARLKYAIVFSVLLQASATTISQSTWLSLAISTIWNHVMSYILASVTIPPSHPLNKQVLSYMGERALAKNASALALQPHHATHKSAHDYFVERQMMSYGSRPKIKRRKEENEEEEDEQRLTYVPDAGKKFVFFFNSWPMVFERSAKSKYDTEGLRILHGTNPGTCNENVKISCLSPSFLGGARPIKRLLEHVQAISVKDQVTTMFRPDNMMWDQGIDRPSRNLNAVTLDDSVKNDLVKDIETYLAKETRRYYANKGLPWRRGFLFYGPPGTGKTSFTNALAGHFKLNVYMISLSSTSLNDDVLSTLYEQLPSRCIVLLEDIDSAGLKREDMKVKKKSSSSKRRHVIDSDDSQYERTPSGALVRRGLTMSGLLNVLDGINSQEGIITIMTSNSPDSLDSALVRPGRIDRKVLFGYATQPVIRGLFVHIFSKSVDENCAGEKASDLEIHSLAEDFASCIPADKLTPAEIQGYLLVHRADPLAAVQGAVSWAEKTLETKAAGVNVAAFASEEDVQRKKAVNNDTKDVAVDTSEEAAVTDEISEPMPDYSSMTAMLRSLPHGGRGVRPADLNAMLASLGPHLASGMRGCDVPVSTKVQPPTPPRTRSPSTSTTPKEKADQGDVQG